MYMKEIQVCDDDEDAPLQTSFCKQKKTTVPTLWVRQSKCSN